MAISHTLNLIRTHPLTKDKPLSSIFRMIKWQIFSRIFKNGIKVNFTDKSFLFVKKGMTGATGNIYFGLHEFNDMGFLLHFLRPEDVFFDVGANVGSYTVLASAHVGAHTFSFEPSPSTFENLLKNIEINNIGDIVMPYNIGIGAENGEIKFTTGLDTVNHIATDNESNTIIVPVKTLHSLALPIPALIKIDVEGFETYVVAGGKSIFENPNLKAIIIELNGSGGRYGLDEKDIHSYFIKIGFRPYHYFPISRKLIEIDSFGSYNTIYLRDIHFIENRIAEADYVNIRGKIF